MEKKYGKLKWISFLFASLRILFGFVFILSATMKFIDLKAFTKALGDFKLFDSVQQLSFFTYAVPIVEIIIGIILILDFETELFSQIATLLLAFFTTIIVVKIFEGEEISCGCFGKLTKDTIDYTTVIRNMILMLWGISLTAYYHKDKATQNITNEIKDNQKWITRFLKSVFTTIIFTFIFFLAVQTIIFALQNRELKNRIMLLTTDRDVLKTDEIAKPFSAINILGDEQKIKYNKNNKRKTLLFIFSVGCGPCKMNLPNWNNITKVYNQNDVRIIGVSMDSIIVVKKYAMENNLNFSVFSVLNDEFKINYKAFVTPQTILIDNEGKVVKVWQGLLNKLTYKEVLESI